MALWALIVFLVSLVPCMVMGMLGANGIFFGPFSDFAITFYVAGGVYMFVTGSRASTARRREYRHGYTTLEAFGKYSLYYLTLPQLEPRTGIEIRAAGQRRLDAATRRERTSQARRAGIQALPRMSRLEAAAAEAVAKEANEVQRAEAAEAPTQRETLMRVLGPEAGNERAKALRLVIAAAMVGFGLIPLSAVAAGVGTGATGSALWLLPLTAVLVAVAVLIGLLRRATSKATRLVESRMGLPSKSLPRWPLLKPIPAASLRPEHDADARDSAARHV